MILKLERLHRDQQISRFNNKPQFLTAKLKASYSLRYLMKRGPMGGGQ